jgi:hypothetical protein
VYADLLDAVVHHYRDSDDREVDIIVQTLQVPVPA